MAISKIAKEPLYVQLQFVLQEKIYAGEWSSGSLLPTEQELCEQYDISRITVRKALSILEETGLIQRVKGRGSIVIKKAPKKSTREILGFTKSVIRQGHCPKTVLLEKRIVIGSGELVELFGLSKEKDALFWVFTCLRLINDEPMVISNHYVEKAVGDEIVKKDLSNISFYKYYEEITGESIHDSEAVISAVPAGPGTAKTLKVNVGAPLLWHRGITYLANKKTIEVSYSFTVGEKYQFETSFSRPNKFEGAKELEALVFLEGNK